MPSIAARIIARVRAMLPADWMGPAGRKFQETIKQVALDGDVASLVVEATQRFAVGRVSREHAEAVKNYAEEEKARIEVELAKRTLEERVRQEAAKAEQEEVRIRTMRTEELLARLRLFDEFQARNALPIWDKQGNMRIVKAPASFDWEEARTLLLNAEEIIASPPSDIDN